MFKTTVEDLRKVFERKGYRVVSDGQLNLAGIRKDLVFSNRFDDTFCVFFKAGLDWVLHQFDCTTDPGMYYVENFANPAGTAVLKPGQYFESHTLGMHKGQYPALVQAKPLTVFRDTNKDGKIDYVTSDRGLFGVNIHRANATAKSVQVDKWSAGCTVVADPKDFDTLMRLAKASPAKMFTYTLIEERDFV